MATAAQKAAEKERAAKNAAKKGEKTSASSSFNYASIGLSQDIWNKLGSAGQAAMAAIGNGPIRKAIEKNQPLPEILDQKEMAKLWKEAESDPVIQKTYGEELTTAKDFLNKHIDLVSAEFQSLTADQQRAYIDAKKNLDEAHAAAGTAYSGFRGQAKEKLDTNQSGIVESSRRQLQTTLNAAGQAFEHRFGSAALAGTKLGGPITAGDAGTYGNTTYGGATYGSVGYDPTGGIGGTQEQDILAAKLQKQQDLAAEEKQSIQLDNISREKKTAEALAKL